MQQSTSTFPSDNLQRAWIALQRVAPLLEERIAGSLAAAGLPDLSWYSVLWSLERAGQPTRPRDLGVLLFIPRYTLSRLIDRMEGEGLVKRLSCPSDQRGQLLDLTPQGRALRQEMWIVYAAAMAEAMSPFSDKDALKLADLLNRLA